MSEVTAENVDFINKDAVKEKACLFWGWFKKLPVIRKLFDKGPEVVTIRLSGVIADSHKKSGKTICHHFLSEAIDKAFDRKSAKAVALIINSPGGSAAQSSLIAAHIRRLSEKENKPVYAFVEDVAASGGYWLACSADEIYVQPVSVVGSIGVISAGFGFQDFIAKHGVERRVYTAGKDKGFMDPFQPEKESDVKRLQKIQKDIHQSFVAWVEDRRGDRLSGAKKSLFEGQFWTGQEATEKGIVDGVADLHSFMIEKFGDDIKLHDVTPGKSFFSLPFLSGRIQHDAEPLIEEYDLRQAKARLGL